jgi:hypothetical protein
MTSPPERSFAVALALSAISGCCGAGGGADARAKDGGVSADECAAARDLSSVLGVSCDVTVGCAQTDAGFFISCLGANQWPSDAGTSTVGCCHIRCNPPYGTRPCPEGLRCDEGADGTCSSPSNVCVLDTAACPP